MFNGRVNLIKRNNLIHCGFKVYNDGWYIISSCNKIWDCKDIVTEGDTSEVTCKRCKKILEKANEDGSIKFK